MKDTIKGILVATLLITTVLNGILIVNAQENLNPDQVVIYGKDFDYIEGTDWYIFETYSVRCCEGQGPDCTVYYRINIGYTQIEDYGFEIGVKFCDWAALPWVEGPDLYIYDWDSGEYLTVANPMGNQDERIWKWWEKGNGNAFVNDNGIVKCKIYVHSACDTVIDRVGIRFYGIDPPEITLAPSSYNFGTIKVGEKSSWKNFVLKNIGGQKAEGTVYLAGSHPSQFEIENEGSFSLNPDAQKTIKVRFAPNSKGYKSAILKADGSNCNDATSSLSGQAEKNAKGFFQGTIINMAGGSSITKYIQNIHTGDIIQSYNIQTHELIPATVTGIKETILEEGEYYLIINDYIQVGPDHLLLINNEWKKADDAQIGDRLIMNPSGENVTIQYVINSIREEYSTPGSILYDLEISVVVPNLEAGYWADTVFVKSDN